MKIDKEQAMQRLSAIEKETAELKKIIEAPDKKSSCVMERVTSVETAIEELPENDEDVLTYHKLKGTQIDGHNLNYQELVIICKALNGGKFPPPNDRYVPWFDFSKKPGSGFFSGDGHYSYWGNVVSVRLSLLNSKLAIYCGKQFEQKWYNYHTNNK